MAVVGMDYYLRFFFADIHDIRILDTGFAAMISNGGAIVSQVDFWESEAQINRLFEKDVTGLDLEDWVEIRDVENDLDDTWQFEIPSTKELYHCVRNFVRDSYGSVLYTIVISVNEDEIVEIIDDLKDGFQSVYVYIFWFTVAMSIFMIIFFSFMLLALILYLKASFKEIKIMSENILCNASKPFLMAGIKIDMLECKEDAQKDNVFDNLKIKYKERLTDFKQRDSEWAQEVRAWSRPKDNFHYMDWYDKASCGNRMRRVSDFWIDDMERLVDDKY